MASSKVEWNMARNSLLRKRRAGSASAPLKGLAVGLLMLGVGVEAAGAQSSREARHDAYRRSAAKPVMAIVALSDQRVSIYDAEGKVLESPISSGAVGYETPAGIFSIVQKKEDHRSNLYEDGEMPFMQRITWTGIALHAGNLPGHPASHGCIRLPMAFAQRLFGTTELGLRVLIVRDDIAPGDISHPALFRPRPVPRELALAAPKGARVASAATEGEIVPGSARHLQALQSVAAARAAELEPAASRQREAARTAARVAAEAAGAARAVRSTEADLARAEAALKDAERRLDTASAPQANERAAAAKAKAQTRVEEVQARLQAARPRSRTHRRGGGRRGPRPDRLHPGGPRSHLRGGAARLLAHRLRRGAEPRDRQGHRLRGGHERRAAGRPEDPPARAATGGRVRQLAPLGQKLPRRRLAVPLLEVVRRDAPRRCGWRPSGRDRPHRPIPA
jgi:hypothetical protein